MADPKRKAKVSRPQIPAVYGLPKHNKGLLPWSHVSERMAQAQVYWITTVDPSGRPHATPVDGLWLDDRLYFGGSQETRRNRNLAQNPAVCVHLESGSVLLLSHSAVKDSPQLIADVDMIVRNMANCLHYFLSLAFHHITASSGMYRQSTIHAFIMAGEGKEQHTGILLM